MTAKELRQKYLDFFRQRGHAIIPSASLIPQNDPTTLFTGSGMQPMISYLLGEKHPMGTRIADSQKSFRTVDIEEVGDNRHTTFFEMLGNWSLGDYFKREQIEWIFEFLTEELELDPAKLYVTVFRGKEEIGIPRDDESVKIWQEQFKKAGIEARAVDMAEKNGMQGGKIFYYDETKNWWSRSGKPEDMPVGEPGGPDSEIFWDFGESLKLHKNSRWKNQPCHVNCDCGRFLEIGNNVFMECVKTGKGFELLKQKNVDYGGGLERQIAAKLDTPDIFLTDLFSDALEVIENLSGKEYEEDKEAFRIIADHLRAATFLIGDGAYPSNKDQGYFVRRLIRRAIRYGHKLEIKNNFCGKIAQVYIDYFKDFYPNLEADKKKILEELSIEEEKFSKTLEKGLKEFENQKSKIKNQNDPLRPRSEASNAKIKIVSGKTAFDLYQSFGFPIELVEELAREDNLIVDKEEFNSELKKHQQLSRTASAGMFKGGLADTLEKTTQLHTTAHLMLAGLRKVLGPDVHQKGSNINGERIRFDFSYPEKLTDDQKKAVENFVNEAISAKTYVIVEEMTLDEAKASGAEGEFGHKYGEKVKVYTIGVSAIGGPAFSREICGGPHVKNTSEIKGRFKIIKEESSSAGVRRIKAVLTREWERM